MSDAESGDRGGGVVGSNMGSDAASGDQSGGVVVGSNCKAGGNIVVDAAGNKERIGVTGRTGHTAAEACAFSGFEYRTAGEHLRTKQYLYTTQSKRFT